MADFERLLKPVGDDKAFVLSNGVKINSLDSLATTLNSLDNNLFNNHVNNEKNDFSSWIREVFKNNYLADKLEHASSKNRMIKIIEEFL